MPYAIGICQTDNPNVVLETLTNLMYTHSIYSTLNSHSRSDSQSANIASMIPARKYIFPNAKDDITIIEENLVPLSDMTLAYLTMTCPGAVMYTSLSTLIQVMIRLYQPTIHTSY